MILPVHLGLPQNICSTANDMTITNLLLNFGFILSMQIGFGQYIILYYRKQNEHSFFLQY
jgi:lipid-binding SYLF domain-containing protein